MKFPISKHKEPKGGARGIGNYLKLILGWPLSIVALFFIVKIIYPNLSNISLYLASLNPFFLFLALLCFLAYYFLRSFLWKMILFYKNHDIPLKETAYLWGISEIKRFIPGNVWSFFGRTAAFSQKGITKSIIVSSLILEAEFFVLGSLVLSLFAFPFILAHMFPFFLQNQFLLYMILGIVILLIICFLNSKFLLKTYSFPFIKHILPHFSFSANFFLLFISSLSLFFFGLGTYFSIHAIFFLNPQNILTLIGFFVFAFFAGYISFITPMGLGVREAVITAGLAQFLSLEKAGLAAICTRIILIFSELIFLAISLTWYNIKNISLKKADMWIKNHWQEILLAFCVLVYIVYFSAASFYRYENYYTGRFDLGNMDQTVWNTLHGHFFQLTNPDGTNIVSRLSFHADFLLIFLAPFYIIWQDPRTLLFIQTCIVSIGAVFTFLIAKKIVKNRTVALLFGLVYLLNPSIEYANLYDFHAVTLATTFFLGAYYFLLERAFVRCILFLLLAAFTKEQVWIVTAMMGVCIAFFYRKDASESKKNSGFRFSVLGSQNLVNLFSVSQSENRKLKTDNWRLTSVFNKYYSNFLLGTCIFLVSTICFYFIFFKAIPAAHGGNHFALAYYSDFGSSPSSVVKSILFSPQKTFGIILAPDRLEYLKQVFLSFGFLPLLAPLFLLFTLPDLIINLLSNNAAFHQIYYQYTAIITPFLFIATVYALKKLKKTFSIRFLYTTSYLLLTAIISAYLYGPLPGAKNPNLDMFTKPQPYADIIDNFLRDIPQKYSIAATNNLGSHLSHRQKIFTIPVGIDEADIILFLLNDKFAAPSLDAQKQMTEQMKRDKKYIEIFKTGDFIVFEKRNLYVQTEPDIDKIKLFPFSVPTLEKRDFAGGVVKIVKTLEQRKEFTSFVISYPSDGLTVNALMDVPTTKKPTFGYPVVIINHGFIRPSLYDTEKSYRLITDYFAAHGFLVIKPDFRGNANSEKENNMSYIVSYPIDVLNLISSIANIQEADPAEIFLWGHSTGSEISLITLAANNQNPDFPIKIKGAALWSSVTDPYRAYQQFRYLFPTNTIPFQATVKLIGTPSKNPLLWQSISPLSYLDDITTPVQIMHGTNDTVVPYQWSIELYDDLVSLNKRTSLQVYPNDDHVLTQFRTDALNKNLQFFEKLLKE